MTDVCQDEAIASDQQEVTSLPDEPESPEAASPQTHPQALPETEVPVRQLISSAGQTVPCSYLDHSGFDPASHLCMCLHYMAVKLSPRRSVSWAYALAASISSFLIFREEYNKSHQGKSELIHFKDLTPSVFKAYMNSLKKQKKRLNIAFRLKSAIRLAADETEFIPLIDLPSVPIEKGEPTEPLYEDGLESLTAVAQGIIDSIREKIKNREIIEAAEPYTFEELDLLRSVQLTNKQIFGWYKFRLEQNLPVTSAWILARVRDAVEDNMKAVALSANTEESFEALYEAEGKHVQIPPEYYNLDRIIIKPNYLKEVLDPYRMMKTMLVHNYPLEFSHEELQGEYCYQNLQKIETRNDVVKLLIHKMVQGRNYQNRENLPATVSMDELLAMYYPTDTEVAAIAVMMMLQAGWNKESVMGVDGDNFEHGLTATIEESVKIIFSEKFRSQGTDVPYDAPKRMLARSDNQNPYSLYNLILLAKELSAPIAKYAEHLVDEVRNRPVNTMFSFIRSYIGFSKSSPANTIDNGSAFAFAVSSILEKHEIYDNGKRLTTAKELTPRLRTTWIYYNSENTPFAFLSQLLGHASRDTTDEFYDNSTQARAKRYDRLRAVLEHIVELLRARKFKGMLSKHAQAQAASSLSVFHLPYFEKALWACRNRYNPDWPSAPKLAQGEKCKALEKCIFCSQFWVLEDSLPYLIERLSHIEELLRDRSLVQFGSELEAEQEAITAILDHWADDEAIEDAIRYRAANTPLLPREMRDLKLIFTTGDLDE